MLRRALVALPLVLLALACASPTLPLPPPVTPTIGTGMDANHVQLVESCGGSEDNAVIIVVNDNPAVTNANAVSGTRADNCGAWTLQVYAHKGDVLEITQQSGAVLSQTLTVQVP